MKFLFLLLGLLSSSISFAALCGSIKNKADTEWVYAEVFSRGHMDLEMIAINKSPSRMVNVSIHKQNPYSGELSSCGETTKADVYFDKNIAVDTTSGQSTSFRATYNICVFSLSGKLIESHTICNSETGD